VSGGALPDLLQPASSRRQEAEPDFGLPDDWKRLWGQPQEVPAQLRWHQIQRTTEALVRQIRVVDRSERFGGLVGSDDLRTAAVHRWFTYKEGFSPELLGAVIETLRLEGSLKVADAFGGVATTALAGMTHEQVCEVRSLEYSPWARFAGQTKLSWPKLEPERLRALMPAALQFPFDASLPFPDLSSFENAKIFHRRTVASLLSARAHLKRLRGASHVERDFFLLGLGAVIEDLSYAMKDGRALRIKGDRRRRRSSLVTGDPPKGTSRVRFFLQRQWTAMIEDLEALADTRAHAKTTLVDHVQGDARELAGAVLPDGSPAFPDGWANLSCFSPPYLNCIDYTELYKLELWLMEHIASQAAFRQTRLGTLRSHPSIKFEPRDSFAEGVDQPVIELVQDISGWLCERGARRDVGPVVKSYFEDMFEVWQGQHALLADDGVAVCVVANSTFARRQRQDDRDWQELWRMPLMTDVLLAHLARLAGFAAVEIWTARHLRPRNVQGGSARESLVVAHKRTPASG
jgi:hypothetical protein